MGAFGDVIYCKDCDLARAAFAPGATANGASTAIEPPPRRMAIKKDANGDPLCTACLDARVEKRRAEFLLHEGKAPLPASRPAPAPEPVMARVEVVPRVRPTRIDVATPDRTPARRARKRNSGNGSNSAAKKRRVSSVPDPGAVRMSKRELRAKERRFAMLAGELGWLRAEQLLASLKGAGRR